MKRSPWKEQNYKKKAELPILPSTVVLKEDLFKNTTTTYM